MLGFNTQPRPPIKVLLFKETLKFGGLFEASVHPACLFRFQTIQKESLY